MLCKNVLNFFAKFTGKSLQPSIFQVAGLGLINQFQAHEPFYTHENVWSGDKEIEHWLNMVEKILQGKCLSMIFAKFFRKTIPRNCESLLKNMKYSDCYYAVFHFPACQADMLKVVIIITLTKYDHHLFDLNTLR